MKNGRTEKVIYTFKIRTLWAGVGQNHTNTICIIPPQLLYLIQRSQRCLYNVTEISFMSKLSRHYILYLLQEAAALLSS